MKRKLSLLLAVLLLLVSVTACNTETETDESAAESENVSETVSGEAVAGIQYETIVSTGKKYTALPAADSKYPDSYGTELCDGVFASSDAGYMDEKLSGYSVSGSALRVEFDLEEDSKQIYKFGISYLSTKSAGIGPIGTSRIYYSEDGEKWKRGTGFFKVPAYEEDTMQQAWLELSEPIDARYIRFEIRGTAGWLFLDELIIIANTPGTSVNQNYLQQLSSIFTADRIKDGSLAIGSTQVDRTQKQVMLSKGCTYKTSYPCMTAFPDTGSMLTDGYTPGSSLEAGAFVGFADGKALFVDLDLGAVYDGISDFALSMYQQANLHYLLPYFVDVFVSKDGSKYDRVGRLFAPNELSVTNYTFALRLTKGVSARYVRFSLPDTDSACFLIEEASVAYFGEDVYTPLYPNVVLPEVTEPQERPGASGSKTNLVAGLPYQIACGTEIAYTQDNLNANTLPSEGILTDGKYSPNTTFNNGYWNRTRGGTNRSIYFDLEYSCSITGFKVSYLNLPDYAITTPNATRLYLSEDGINWYAAGTAYAEQSDEIKGITVTANLSKPLRARFVCISFAVTPHVYADEIEIYGTQKVTSNTLTLDKSGARPFTRNQYAAPSDEILGGVTDLALIYYNIVDGNEDFFLPYVAYLDEKGNIKDTMFDGFLFLPSTHGMPSGGYPYASEEKPNNSDDWDYQFEENFKEGINFDALNKTTAKVKEALSLPADFKVKVYATIMYPAKTATGFEGYDFSKNEDRIRYIGEYMDRYLQKFAEVGYENLTFAGFYWFEEAIPYDEDPIIIQATAKLAEAKGSQLFWIPYYTARGYSDWSSYGFVNACMQPNYVFRDNVPISQLENAANYIRELGMGIEIEIDSPSLTQLTFYKRYMRYLGYGLEAGYMKDCIHMYYQGGAVYYKACYSQNAMGRSAYDATYQFIKGTIEPPKKLDAISLTTKDGQVLQGKLFDNSSKLLEAELTVSAEHGSVTVSPDGNFLYVPNSGYKGKDQFTFRYTNFLSWSDDIVVNITIE